MDVDLPNLKSVSKALAGALVAIVAALFLKWGIDLPPSVAPAAEVLLDATIAGIIGYLGVYFAPKNKGAGV